LRAIDRVRCATFWDSYSPWIHSLHIIFFHNQDELAIGRMICSQDIVSAPAQDLLRLPESMTITKNGTDSLRFSFLEICQENLMIPLTA